MRHIYLIILSLLLGTTTAFTQDKQQLLLTIDDQEFTVENFERVYLKNFDLVQDDSQKSIENYLELYIDYQLKVQEAYRKGLDKEKAYQKEFMGYRRQLARNFLADTAVTEQLVKEAYNRTIQQVRAQHILVKLPQNALPEDTLKAYQKIMTARSRVQAGEHFDKVAQVFSEDPSAPSNGGDLGWFSAFKMVYPFETAAFETPINTVSLPFRTRFGYHIVQPTALRQNKGAAEIAHIMLDHRKKDSLAVQKSIDSIYQVLTNGGTFESLAKTLSDDTKSAQRGGRLGIIKQGQLNSEEFERVIFSLDAEGAISEPFKTQYGWHIVKLLKKKPIGTYKEEKEGLTQRVKRDGRARKISNRLLGELRVFYQVDQEETVADALYDRLIKVDGRAQIAFDDTEKAMEGALTMRDTTITYSEIALRLNKELQKVNYSKVPKSFIHQKVKELYDTLLLQYHQEHLEVVNPEFNALINDYKQGLLLFELMQRQVWGVAKEDSTALESYYNKHQEQYDAPFEEIKGKVSGDFQKDLERTWLLELRENAEINLNKKAWKRLQKKYPY